MPDIDIIDFYPDDDDQLCLYVYPQHRLGWRFSLGNGFAKIHVNDIAPGGRLAKGGIYKFPMLLSSIHRINHYADKRHVLCTEAYLEECLRLINQDIAADIQMVRLKNLERWAKDDKNQEDTPVPELLTERANGAVHPKVLPRYRDILVASAEGKIKSPFYARVPSYRKPYLHQKVIREYAISIPNPGIWCDMGTGKTQAIAEALWWRFERRHIESALVVCPLSIIENWEKEIDELTDLTALALTAKSTKGKIEMLNERWWWSQVIIVNTESVSGLMEWFDNHLNWSKTYTVLDESTTIKNPSTKRAKAMHKIGRKSRYKAALSGSPITQGSWDVYSQFLFLDGGFTFGNSHTGFIDTYFWRNPWAQGQMMPKPGADETISEKMFQRGVRFTKEECLDLPEKIYFRRMVRLPEYQADVYRRIQVDSIAKIQGGFDVEITAPIILVELLRLAQITSGHITGKKNKTEEQIIKEMINNKEGFVEPSIKATVFFKLQPKIDMLRNMLRDELQDEQVVIWTRFIPERKLITDMLTEERITFSSFDTHGRQEAVDVFQQGKARCFVANPQSARHGITLTAASVAIYLSNSFSLEQRQQSEDRIHRIGATGDYCRYFDIIVPGTVDDYVLDVLMSKGDVAAKILQDPDKDFLKQSFDVPQRKDWWKKVLGLASYPTLEDAEEAYQIKALVEHPDMGGDIGKMQRLNEAIIEARKHLGEQNESHIS